MGANLYYDLEIVFKIILAIFISGAIGWERGQHNRPAGFRTHVLVCVGSTMVMIVAEYLAQKHPGMNFDPQRMGAQVISGIGFLCAGTILKTGDSTVKGLTTAAALWATACVGLAIGAGAYFIAIFASICMFTVIVIFAKIEHHFRYDKKVVALQMSIRGGHTKIEEVSGALGVVGVTVKKVVIELSEEFYAEPWDFVVTMSLNNPKNISLEGMLTALSSVQDVRILDTTE